MGGRERKKRLIGFRRESRYTKINLRDFVGGRKIGVYRKFRIVNRDFFPLTLDILEANFLFLNDGGGGMFFLENGS